MRNDTNLTSGFPGYATYPAANLANTQGDDWSGGDIAAFSPVIVGNGTASFTATTNTSLTPGLPTGWAAGDIHVMLCHNNANAGFATPSGWTVATDGTHTLNDNNTAAQNVVVFWRRAVAGDTGPSVALTTNNVTTVRGAVIIGVRNCATSGVPFEICDRLLNAAAATISFPSVTSLTDHGLALALGAYADDPTARSTPTGWAQAATNGWVFTSALGNDMSLNYFAMYKDQAGATGSFSTTVSGGTFVNSVSVGAVLVFRPETPALWIPPMTELISSGGMIGRRYVCEAHVPRARRRRRHAARSPWKARRGLYVHTEAVVRHRQAAVGW